MKKIYIAGPYSSDTVIGMLGNIRNGIKMAARIMAGGFAVFCPWLDHQIFLHLPDGSEMGVPFFQEASMEWLKVSDAVLVLSGWEKSNGTKSEIQVAKDLGIPVFFGLLDLYEWARRKGE